MQSLKSIMWKITDASRQVYSKTISMSDDRPIYSKNVKIYCAKYIFIFSSFFWCWTTQWDNYSKQFHTLFSFPVTPATHLFKPKMTNFVDYIYYIIIIFNLLISGKIPHHFCPHFNPKSHSHGKIHWQKQLLFFHFVLHLLDFKQFHTILFTHVYTSYGKKCWNTWQKRQMYFNLFTFLCESYPEVMVTVVYNLDTNDCIYALWCFSNTAGP